MMWKHKSCLNSTPPFDGAARLLSLLIMVSLCSFICSCRPGENKSNVSADPPNAAASAGQDRAAAANGRARANASDKQESDGQDEPHMYDCADVNDPPDPAHAPSEVQLQKIRDALHHRIILDITRFNMGRVVNKWAYYILSGVAILLGVTASFLIALDWQHVKDGNSTNISRPRKAVIFGFQLAAVTITGAITTFGIAETWNSRVNGIQALRDLDSDLILNGCAHDRRMREKNISDIYHKLDLLESTQYTVQSILGEGRTNETHPQSGLAPGASGTSGDEPQPTSGAPQTPPSP